MEGTSRNTRKFSVCQHIPRRVVYRRNDTTATREWRLACKESHKSISSLSPTDCVLIE